MILFLVAALGACLVRRNLRPVPDLSRFAHQLAAGDTEQLLPFSERTDEVDELARGLGRVVDLRNRLETLAYTDNPAPPDLPPLVCR